MQVSPSVAAGVEQQSVIGLRVLIRTRGVARLTEFRRGVPGIAICGVMMLGSIS